MYRNAIELRQRWSDPSQISLQHRRFWV